MPLNGEELRAPLVKPETRKRVKGRNQRQAAKVVKSVRQQCVDRDVFCRASEVVRTGSMWDWIQLESCEGVSEWAHLGDQKRFKTRGQPPEVRHTTAGSLMLCTRHHRDYDEGRLSIIGADANKPLRFKRVA